MARVKYPTRKYRKSVLKQAKGYYGRKKSCYSVAVQTVEKAGQYAYRDRKVRKRDFRSLWIIRLNAALREIGLKYSVFINQLKKANIELNRKTLANIAYENPTMFRNIVAQVSGK